MNNPLLVTIVGILLNSAGIAFNFYYLNVIGSIICLIGVSQSGLSGNAIKKARTHAIISIPFSILSVVIGIFASQATDSTSIMLGINVFFFIYFTYYFTEALINCAQSVNELAATRSFRSIWTLCGIITFLYFIAFSSFVSTVVMIAKILFLLSALYYCSSINSSGKVLFK